MATIAANEFARQWQDIREDALSAVDRVGESGWLVLGDEVKAFETEFAQWWGVPDAIGVASGLDALEIALRCGGVGGGDLVLTSPLSAFATTLAILRAGAEPVWCDIDESGGLDLDQAASALGANPAIRAVVPVHLYGHPLDPGALGELAVEHGVLVVEDCAQSAGASREGKPTGVAGAIAATSLYPTKNLGAMGDGGLVLTSDPELAAKARELRNYGLAGRDGYQPGGLNSRLDELQAAILRSAMLPRLDDWLDRRRQIASTYEDALRGSGLRPIVAAAGRSAHHLFPVEVAAGDAAEVGARFAELGIAVGRHYPYLCSTQPAVRDRGLVIGDLPVARRISARELSLPINPHLGDEEVAAVIAACFEICP